ncbi:hypothetical protein BWQ96_04457 [Gracilariopsis chorda]|uniref:Uncharacterized protein n=1 Tax=Gracilariopsis chorda TaxID=448386 RepID=A0A2V3IXC9_9FLOR|nr:hypothetical protein BWQ96_04457 [Gracilariopsis chorda]|eukprot:PXF45790.1 hypothetical protein BWQ96_04457 [Gracilariopsis chorda]
MNPAEEDLQKARKEGNIFGVRRPREESDNSAAHIEEIIPVPSRNQPSQQKKRQKPSIDLPLEKKLQLDVVRHMETVTSSKLSVADAIHKSLIQRAAPPRDDLRTIIREEITAALSSDLRQTPAALPSTSLPVSEANPFRAFASRFASNRDHRQS